MEFRLGNLCKNPPFSLPLTGAPSFASLPTLREEHSSTSPNPCCFARSQTYARPMSFGQQATAYSQNGRRGAGVKVPLCRLSHLCLEAKYSGLSPQLCSF